MTDDKAPRRSSGYANVSTAVLLRKLETHRRMTVAIENELARRSEAEEQDDS